MKPLQVAIDGPAGTGKSTVTRRVAQRFGLFYVDTGAMYRAVGLMVDRAALPVEEGPSLDRLLDALDLRLEPGPLGLRVIAGGEDVTQAIRTPRASEMASRVAALPSVRRRLVALQQAEAQRQGRVILEGRDIGTVVLPEAPIKVFLTASPEVRARRRLAELEAAGRPASFEDVLAEQRLRDERDTGREDSPLRPAPEALILDTSTLTIEEVVARIGEAVERVDTGDAPR